MITTLAEARSALKKEGLHVSWSGAEALWIAATVREAGNGITLADEACVLVGATAKAHAVFPAEGMQTSERQGTLNELATFILAVFSYQRQEGGKLVEAYRKCAEVMDRQLAAPELEPCDEWQRRLVSLAKDCDVSRVNQALSREEMYD